MPAAGSQVVLCDIPIRFDTYVGCGHGCSYCFVSRKSNIKNIKAGEGIQSLRDFIKGKRSGETKWCDWDIPLHWGGLSDPFQPAERVMKRSLEALRVFAETQYPFVVSTKSDLIAEEPYLSLIKQCNCVVQFSACGRRFDAIEKGAATYERRLAAAEKIAKYRRVNIRLQPYIPAMFTDTLRELPHLAEIGVHGVIVEGMKFTKPKPGTIMNGSDFVFPAEELARQFSVIRATAHRHGLRFYCGENRLRSMSDDLCCCGVDGLGWKVNTMNLNHLIFDPDSVEETPAMKKPGTISPFKSIHQKTVWAKNNAHATFADNMRKEAERPVWFICGGGCTFTAEQSEQIRQYMRAALKKSGRRAKDVDLLLGTNGMAGHYFGSSQWTFPTPEAYEKMRTILPIGERDAVLSSFGVRPTKGYIYRELNKGQNPAL